MVLAALKSGLQELITIYQENPLTFLYETDLQAWLFARLQKAIPDTVSTRPSVLPRETFKDPEQIRTPLVHLEYSNSRFDLAIIDPDLVQSSVEYIGEHGSGVQNEAVWNLRVMAAIELKHWTIGYRPHRFVRELKKDIKKLKDYLPYYENAPNHREFTGIACLFIQSFSPLIPEQLRAAGLPILEHWDGEISSGITGLVVTPRESWRVPREEA